MTTILQPPKLKHDAYMKKHFGTEIIPRGMLERRVLWNLLAQLSEHGFENFQVDDGDDEPINCDTPQDVMELVFNLDECYLYCSHNSGTKTHWIRLVLGNDGWDLVSDYGCPTPDYDGFGKLMDAFDGEEYC